MSTLIDTIKSGVTEARSAMAQAAAEITRLRTTSSVMLGTLLAVRTDLLRTDFESDAARCKYMLAYLERAIAHAEGRS